MNQHLKRGLIFIGIITVVALSYGVYKDAALKKGNRNSQKSIEIKNSNITGYYDGQLAFRLKVKYMWAARSKYLFQARGIEKGVIYNGDGSPIIDEIGAGVIYVNTKSKTLTAYENVKTRLLKKESSSEATSPNTFIQINAQELRYYNAMQKTYVYTDVSLIYGNSKIFPAQGVEIDHNSNQVYIKQGYRLLSNRTEVTGNEMSINLDAQWAMLSGGVEAIRHPKPYGEEGEDERETELESQRTELWCNTLSYNTTDKAAVITVDGSVVIFQADKEIRAAHGYYNKKENYFEMEGNVDILTESLVWILGSDQKDFKNEEVRDSVQMGTQIKADKIQFYAGEKRVVMIGNVRVIQKDKTLTCDYLNYEDDTGFLTLKGNVEIVRKGKQDSKLKTNELRVNIKEEELEAEDGVETEFYIVKKNKS